MDRHRLLARAIGLSVPLLNIFRRPDPWPYPLEDLAVMGEGSLGRELFSFLDDRQLGYLPKYEVHDAYHALLGYGTTVSEELRLQAFMFGNRNATVAGRVLLAMGFVLFPAKWSTLQVDFRRGRAAAPLREVPVGEMIPQPMAELRVNLCIA